ncbi:hypothetical protein Tco_0675067, partial [Tanacetum coccineum]
RSEVAVIALAAVVAVGGSEMERDEVRGWPAVVHIRGEGGIGGGRGGVVVVSIHGEGDEDESGGLVVCACSCWRGTTAAVAGAGRIPVTTPDFEGGSSKKQKVDEDRETIELQSLIKVILDEEEVAIDVVPLATKPPSIVDWKIHKEGKISYYQIIRADRKSQMYKVFSQMLKSFSKEDLEDLYKLVKPKYGSTRPVEDLDLIYMEI